MPPKRKIDKGTRNKIIGVSLCGIIIILLIWAFWPGAPIIAKTTFKTVTRPDYENVSEHCTIQILVPKSSYDDGWEDSEDIYDPSNFEYEKKDHAGDISFDATAVDYFWVKINPDEDEYWLTTEHGPYSLTENREITLPVYHLSSNVNLNSLKRDALPDQAWNTDGNFTMIMGYPMFNPNGTHRGNDWKIDDDLADLTESDIQKLYNEHLYRSQAPAYLRADDLEKEYDTSLKRLTNAFALRFTANASINITDGSVHQINFTIRDENYAEDIQVVISAQMIYLIFTDPFDCYVKPYTFDYEIVMAANITISNIHSGRLKVPRNDDNLGTFTVYSQIVACYYAKARFEAVIIKKINFIDLLKLPWSVIELTKEIELDNYPNIPFKRVIISHPEKTYESSIEWIENYPYTLEGFDTHVNFGPANYDLLGFPLWNRPWFLLVHSPGKDTFIYKATAKVKDISKKIVSVPEKIIHRLRGEGDLLKKEIDELKRDKMHWKEKASDLEQELMNRSLTPITGLPRGSEFRLSTIPKDVLLAVVIGIIAIIIVGIIVGGIA